MSEKFVGAPMLVEHRDEAREHAERFGVKQYKFYGVLLRVWKSLTPDQQREALFGGTEENKQPQQSRRRQRVA